VAEKFQGQHQNGESSTAFSPVICGKAT